MRMEKKLLYTWINFGLAYQLPCVRAIESASILHRILFFPLSSQRSRLLSKYRVRECVYRTRIQNAHIVSAKCVAANSSGGKGIHQWCSKCYNIWKCRDWEEKKNVVSHRVSRQLWSSFFKCHEELPVTKNKQSQ